ncbi:MAG: pyrimidine utilization protein B [Acidobacteria bacterium]|nr:MAG: pyrimidine utilization protein B [Acidobacteriota bacterium]
MEPLDMMRFPTKPQALEVDAERSAVIVVDMQNAFASKGGMFDLSGLDISGAHGVIDVLKGLLDVARQASMKVVYLQMGYDEALTTSGGPDSPNSHKELALLLMKKRPELKGKVLTEGQWDWKVVEELKPQPGDLLVNKTRYSGFCGTPLDSLLRTRGINTLFFTGIATNVCVESTLRDAFFLDYWPILLRDATMQAGPPLLQEATIQNVELALGWTLSASEFVQTVNQHILRGSRV